jgi:hypothetical protein
MPTGPRALRPARRPRGRARVHHPRRVVRHGDGREEPAAAGELTRGLIAAARGLGYTVEDEAWRGAHLFGLRAPAGADSARLQTVLRERRVVVSQRGDAVRVAPHLYNTPDDVAALADALRAAAG